MRVAFAAAVAAFILSSAPHARAAEADEPTEVEPRSEPDWGIDVGVGGVLGGIGLAGGSGVAGGSAVGGLGAIPWLQAGLERRLSDRLWLMLRGSGSYVGSNQGEVGMRATSVAADLGLRHALTAPEPLEVSWYGALKGSYASYRDSNVYSDENGTYATPTSRSFSAGLLVGLALDKHFNDWLGMRIRVDVAELGYARASSQGLGGAYGPATESWFAQLELGPSFALRFRF